MVCILVLARKQKNSANRDFDILLFTVVQDWPFLWSHYSCSLSKRKSHVYCLLPIYTNSGCPQVSSDVPTGKHNTTRCSQLRASLVLMGRRHPTARAGFSLRLQKLSSLGLHAFSTTHDWSRSKGLEITKRGAWDWAQRCMSHHFHRYRG